MTNSFQKDKCKLLVFRERVKQSTDMLIGVWLHFRGIKQKKGGGTKGDWLKGILLDVKSLTNLV